jgi:hypothetical protein
VVGPVKDWTRASAGPVHLKDRLCNRTGKNRWNRPVFPGTGEPGDFCTTYWICWILWFFPTSAQAGPTQVSHDEKRCSFARTHSRSGGRRPVAAHPDDPICEQESKLMLAPAASGAQRCRDRFFYWEVLRSSVSSMSHHWELCQMQGMARPAEQLAPVSFSASVR